MKNVQKDEGDIYGLNFNENDMEYDENQDDDWASD